MEYAAKKVKLDVDQFKIDFDLKAKTLFEEDLKLAKEQGVRGFPTLLFFDNAGNKEIVYGSKSYNFYETAILKLNPSAMRKNYSNSWENLFSIYSSLAAKEFSVLSGINRMESEKLLDELSNKNILKKLTTKNGSIWMVKNSE